MFSSNSWRTFAGGGARGRCGRITPEVPRHRTKGSTDFTSTSKKKIQDSLLVLIFFPQQWLIALPVTAALDSPPKHWHRHGGLTSDTESLSSMLYTWDQVSVQKFALRSCWIGIDSSLWDPKKKTTLPRWHLFSYLHWLKNKPSVRNN